MRPAPAGRAALGAVLALLSASPLLAWGQQGHRLVNTRATAGLPAPLDGLFVGNSAYLAAHSNDPDYWREAGEESEEPNHFLDLDALGTPPFADLDADEAAYRRRHGAKADELGRLPWRTAEVYAQLVAAFRARDPGRVLERAAVLGHYVADAHVPLHATLNYDGQLTGQRGVHGRWESQLPERFAAQVESGVRAAQASRVDDPVRRVLDVLVDSQAASLELLESDRLAAGPRDYADTPGDDRYDSAFYSRLWEREGPRLVARLSASATLVASLWLSAWEDAGRPAVDPAFRVAYVRGQRRALVVSLDGGGAALLDDAMKRGLMPELDAVRARGYEAAGALGPLPVKTAAAHAALFTGAWSDVNGVGGNDVPAPGGTVLQAVDGFDARRLTAEPLWVSAARQGLEVTVAQATHVAPFDVYERGGRFGDTRGRLRLMDGYTTQREPPVVYGPGDVDLRGPLGVLKLPPHAGTPRAFSLNLLGTRLEGLMLDDPADPAEGFDTVRLSTDRDLTHGIVLKPLPAGDPAGFAPLEVRAQGETATAFFRLFELAPDGSGFRLFRSALHVLETNRAELTPAAQAGSGGFVGGGAWGLYEQGAFGPPLWKGGDGTAERRYLETMDLVVRQFGNLVEFAARSTRWDLLVTYLPMPDEAMHEWGGWLDPQLPGHDPQLAARLQPWLDESLRGVDRLIGRLAALAGPDTVLAVVADHGHVGVDRALQPNVALRRAGLLVTGRDDQVDLSRTRAVYFPGNSGHVLLNRVGRPGGIVRPEEEAGVKAAVRKALLDVRDPQGGRRPVLDVFEPGPARCTRGTAPGVPVVAHCPTAGPPSGGDLYLSLSQGYTLSSGLGGDVVVASATRGDHFTDPQQRALHAAVLLAGPGVRAGVRGGLVGHVDVAPTLLALLGADPSPDATGAVIRGALTDPPAPLRAERAAR